jgi:hypothetical protein
MDTMSAARNDETDCFPIAFIVYLRTDVPLCAFPSQDETLIRILAFPQEK